MPIERSGLALVRDFLEEKAVVRPPYFLWSTSLAPKVVRRRVMDLLCDPGLIANNVTSCVNLFGPDAIVTVFSPEFPIGACSISVEPFSVVLDLNSKMCAAILEGIKRVDITLGKQVALVAAFPGIVSFALQIEQKLLSEFGKEISMDEILSNAMQVRSELLTLFLEGGTSIVAQVETVNAFAKMDHLFLESSKNDLRTLSNITSYHNKHMMLVINDFPLIEKQVQILTKFNSFDAFLIHSDSSPEALGLPGAIGWTIPSKLFDEGTDPEAIGIAQKEFLVSSPQLLTPLFLSTHQEISDESSFAALRAFSTAIKKFYEK